MKGLSKIIALLILLCLLPINVGAEFVTSGETVNIIVKLSEPAKNTKSLFGSEISSLQGKAKFTYDKAFKGFTVEGTVSDAKRIEKMYGVSKVYISRTYSLPQTFENEASGLSLLSDTTFKGEGMAVAVIDSEFIVNHPYFALTNAETVKYTKSDIDSLIKSGLHANVSDSSGVYKSEKIPFAYDYVGEDADTASTSNYHGTHVAGIVAGQNSEIHGSAPEAQLILMKVFGDSGYATDTIIINAIEDAIKMQVDVINLSLGSQAGFTGDLYSDIFKNAEDAGIYVACSAGNSGIIGEGNVYTTKKPLTSNPDYGTVSTPSTSEHALSVGAYEELFAATKDSKGFYGGAGEIASFSSWGVTPDLHLKPDISAPGVGVNSSYPSPLYHELNGTSMASPYVAGAFATTKEYVQENYTFLTINEQSDLTKRLLTSTATVITTGGIPYSPRAQGSGGINIDAAISSPAVLSKSKVELFDKLQNTFSFSFTVKNLTAESLGYKPSGYVLTDGYTESDGKKFVSGLPSLINNANISYSQTEINLGPYETREITVTINLDNTEMGNLLNVFTNGFYVEGYIQLSSDENPPLSLPFMGFYGDWLSAPVFDTPVNEGGGVYNKTGMTNYTTGEFLGVNQYVTGSIPKTRYMAATQSDELTMQFALLRNVKSIDLALINSSGYVEWSREDVATYEPKAYYQNKTLNVLKVGAHFRITDIDNIKLVDGYYTCRLTATLDYGDGSQKQVLDYVISADSTNPYLKNVTISNDSLIFKAEDAHAMQALEVYDTSGQKTTYVIINGGSEVSLETAPGVKLSKIIAIDYAKNTAEIPFKKAYVAYFAAKTDLRYVGIYYLPQTMSTLNTTVENYASGDKLVGIFMFNDNISPYKDALWQNVEE